MCGDHNYRITVVSVPCAEIIWCPHPGSPRDGAANFTGLVEGSQVSYNCSIGFNLAGSMIRTCQHDATWSGTEPACEGTTEHINNTYNYCILAV